MEGAGVVRRLAHGGDHARFELAEELTEHHHHLICESCGSIRDVVFDAIGRAEDFVPHGHTIDVYGTCRSCRT